MADLHALRRTTELYRNLRPKIAVYGTPKAALISSLAARIVGTAHRLYVVHGLRLEGLSGRRAGTLTLLERLTCHNSTRVIAVSPSLRQKMVERRLVSRRKISVAGHYGSACGVDVPHFALSQTKVPFSSAPQLPSEQSLAPSTPVVLYAGRLSRDKGIETLIAAWRLRRSQDAVLVLAGGVDASDPPPPSSIQEIRNESSVVALGPVDDMAPWLERCAFLVLPTLREGFPQVALEAAAASRPVVATRATGCVDAVLDNVTGLIVEKRNPVALAKAIDELLDDPIKRQRLGSNGQVRVERFFTVDQRNDYWAELLEGYSARDEP